MATKKPTKSGNGKKAKTGTTRREFVKTGAAVALGTAVAGGFTTTGCTTGAPSTKGVYHLAMDRYNKLLEDKQLRDQMASGVDDFAKLMVRDAEVRTTFLQTSESVLLVRIYNEHKEQLEKVSGALDGRTLEGRLKKMIYVSELFDGVSGLDGIYLGDGEDESAAQACWSCSCGGGYSVGCCVTHFWSWNGGGRKCYCCCC